MPYSAKFEPDRKAGGYVVTFPDFPVGATQGESFPEAMEMAQDMLKMILADHIDTNRNLPPARRHRGRNYHFVALPALQEAKVALYRAFRQSGMRKSELASRTGIQLANLNRLFDLDHASRLDQIETAFRALGKQMRVEIEDAA